MDTRKSYWQDGNQKGFEGAKRTGGKVRQEYRDNCLISETTNLSTTHSREFIEGWHEGFTDGIVAAMSQLIKKDDFGETIYMMK